MSMTLRRLTVLPALAVVLVLATVACGTAESSTLETLPPIRTTTSTTTTTTTPYSGRIFYEVKSGDNLSEIARSYGVPRQSIMDLNGLTSEIIHPGDMLEIPNDIRLDETLPTSTTSSTEAP